MVAEMRLSYVWGRRCRSPPPLLRGGGVQGTSVDGFFDALGHVVALPCEVGDVFGAEVVVGGAGMVAYGGLVGIGEGLSDFVVVFLDVHGAFGLADVCGCAWVVGGAGAWA
jgi:hypothetical protein